MVAFIGAKRCSSTQWITTARGGVCFHWPSKDGSLNAIYPRLSEMAYAVDSVRGRKWSWVYVPIYPFIVTSLARRNLMSINISLRSDAARVQLRPTENSRIIRPQQQCEAADAFDSLVSAHSRRSRIQSAGFRRSRVQSGVGRPSTAMVRLFSFLDP